MHVINVMVCDFFSEALNCPELQPSIKAVTSCQADAGGRRRCTVRCESGAVSVFGQDAAVTECGADTNYVWTHVTSNATLPSCSSTS